MGVEIGVEMERISALLFHRMGWGGMGWNIRCRIVLFWVGRMGREVWIWMGVFVVGVVWDVEYRGGDMVVGGGGWGMGVRGGKQRVIFMMVGEEEVGDGGEGVEIYMCLDVMG